MTSLDTPNTKSQKDLNTWETFLGSFNAKSFFLEEGWASSYAFSLMQLNLVVTVLYLVSSGHMVHGHTHGKTTILVSSSFFPIVLGLSLWCRELRNKHVMFNTDNESTVYVINKETVKDTKLLSLLHMLVLICLQNNIFFRARHIEGAQNILTDSLSCLQVGKFKALAPDMNPQSTPFLAHLLPEN